MVIKVCDAVMGSGKTMAAIAEMNKNVDRKYVFVTPYLDEVRRICEGCEERDFVEPDSDVSGTKLRHFKALIQDGRSVVCTHSLFRWYDREAIESIAAGGYTLILDESITAMDVLTVGHRDTSIMFESGILRIDNEGRVVWSDDKYAGVYSPLRETIDSGYVTLEEGKMFLWKLPFCMFEVFDEVIILTYMFRAQPLYYYFKAHDVEFDFIGTKKGDDGVYRFAEYRTDQKIDLPPIHILDDTKLNSIGDARTALSLGWYKKASRDDIERLKKNTYNVLHNKFHSKSKECLWTTYVEYKDALDPPRFGKSYASWNMRATNKWSDRAYLAYLVNVFPHPSLVHFFASKGLKLDQDAWALSEMVQWVWRSSVRKGEEIWVYMPSRRMRDMLKEWIVSVTREDSIE